MRITIDDDRGLTLMEIVITIAILGIVSIMISSFLRSGITFHNEAVEQVDNQANLRLIAYRITDILRNARHIDLQDDVDDTVLTEYLYLDGNQIMYVDHDSESVFADNLISDMGFSVEVDHGQYILTMTLTSETGKSIVTEILLNNITPSTISSGSVGNGIHDIVEYDYTAP